MRLRWCGSQQPWRPEPVFLPAAEFLIPDPGEEVPYVPDGDTEQVADHRVQARRERP